MVAKEVKLMARRRRQDSPVYRRLANENQVKTAIPREHPQVGSSCRKPGLDHSFENQI